MDWIWSSASAPLLQHVSVPAFSDAVPGRFSFADSISGVLPSTWLRTPDRLSLMLARPACMQAEPRDSVPSIPWHMRSRLPFVPESSLHNVRVPAHCVLLCALVCMRALHPRVLLRTVSRTLSCDPSSSWTSTPLSSMASCPSTEIPSRIQDISVVPVLSCTSYCPVHIPV